MAIVYWPEGVKIAAADYGIEFDVRIKVAQSGRVYTQGLPGARWKAAITFRPDLAGARERERWKVEAMLTSLEGGANLLAMPHFGRPIPRGTLRGAPVLAQGAAPGADVLRIGSANGTLLRGDVIGLAGQLLLVTEDATPAGGVLDVRVAPSPRRVYTAGTPIDWNAPPGFWIPSSPIAGPFPYLPGSRPAFSVEFVEA